MSMSAKERQEILQLLATGKITVDEAADLLAGVSKPEVIVDKEPIDEPVAEKGPATAEDLDELIKVEPDPAQDFIGKRGGSRPSWLRVRVSDTKTGKNKVTVNVPLRLVRFGLSVGSRFAPELNELDWNEIDSYLGAEKGMLVDVQDEEDGEHVQIYVD